MTATATGASGDKTVNFSSENPTAVILFSFTGRSPKAWTAGALALLFTGLLAGLVWRARTKKSSFNRI